MRIAAPRESRPGEQRVALAPDSCKKLIQAGYAVAIENGAGEAAFYTDAAYREAGSAVESDPAALLGSADIVLKVNAPSVDATGRDEAQWMRPGTILLASIPDLMGPGRTAEMTYYETAAGAKVFAAGALNFAASVDDPVVARLLDNVWARLTRP